MYAVRVTKLLEGQTEPTVLDTKANLITVTADGELLVESAKQHRQFTSEQWDTLTVTKLIGDEA